MMVPWARYGATVAQEVAVRVDEREPAPVVGDRDSLHQGAGGLAPAGLADLHLEEGVGFPGGEQPFGAVGAAVPALRQQVLLRFVAGDVACEQGQPCVHRGGLEQPGDFLDPCPGVPARVDAAAGPPLIEPRPPRPPVRPEPQRPPGPADRRQPGAGGVDVQRGFDVPKSALGSADLVRCAPHEQLHPDQAGVLHQLAQGLLPVDARRPRRHHQPTPAGALIRRRQQLRELPAPGVLQRRGVLRHPLRLAACFLPGALPGGMDDLLPAAFQVPLGGGGDVQADLGEVPEVSAQVGDGVDAEVFGGIGT
ncbi:hypothetical protein ABZ312_44220 [Streptomyces sp. NPDC006207]